MRLGLDEISTVSVASNPPYSKLGRGSSVPSNPAIPRPQKHLWAGGGRDGTSGTWGSKTAHGRALDHAVVLWFRRSLRSSNSAASGAEHGLGTRSSFSKGTLRVRPASGPPYSQPTAQQKIYLYPLRERPVEAADDVWCAYVTCIPMGLVAGWKTFRGLNWAQRPLWSVGGTIPSF